MPAQSIEAAPERHARRLLTTLERKALLHLDGIEPHRMTSLHDLQYDYLHATHDTLPALHTKLVEAYRPQCLNGWASGPNDGYFFQHLARHLVQANRPEELHQLLCEFDWLRAKLTAPTMNALLADSEVLRDAPRLRLAAPVLARDPHQVAGQLTGRLLSQPDRGIHGLLAQARRQTNLPYLYALQPTLTPPGGPLRRTLTGHTGGVTAVAVSPDGRQLILASDDRTLKVWDLIKGVILTSLSADAELSACAIAPDGVTIAAGDTAGRVHFLRLAGVKRE